MVRMNLTVLQLEKTKMNIRIWKLFFTRREGFKEAREALEAILPTLRVIETVKINLSLSRNG